MINARIALITVRYASAAVADSRQLARSPKRISLLRRVIPARVFDQQIRKFNKLAN